MKLSKISTDPELAIQARGYIRNRINHWTKLYHALLEYRGILRASKRKFRTATQAEKYGLCWEARGRSFCSHLSRKVGEA